MRIIKKKPILNKTNSVISSKKLSKELCTELPKSTRLKWKVVIFLYFLQKFDN